MGPCQNKKLKIHRRPNYLVGFLREAHVCNKDFMHDLFFKLIIRRKGDCFMDMLIQKTVLSCEVFDIEMRNHFPVRFMFSIQN